MDLRRKCLVTQQIKTVMGSILVLLSLTITPVSACNIKKPLKDTFICEVHQQNTFSSSIQDVLGRGDASSLEIGMPTVSDTRNIDKSNTESMKKPDVATDEHCFAFGREQGEALLRADFSDLNRDVIGHGHGCMAAVDNTSMDKIENAEGAQRKQPGVPTEGQYNVHKDKKADKDMRCIKRVHIFSSMTHIIPFPEMQQFRALLQTSSRENYESEVDCASQGYNCDVVLTLGDKLRMIKGKDAVIFGMVPTIWKGHTLGSMMLNIAPDPAQTWIYYSTESPCRASLWAESFDIARMKYHVLMTYNKESDIHIPFGYYRPFDSPHFIPNDTNFMHDEFYTNRTGLLSWVSSNCDEVFWPRMPFVSKLLDALPVDDYGSCGRKKCLPRRSDQCNRLFASYKFFLAIPNSECRDYITEKFWMIALKYGSVPLVLGAFKEDYERVAPPGSYIHFTDYKTLKELADYLNRVDQDDALYRSLHDWRRHGEVVSTYPLRPEALCRTVPHIHPRKAGDFKYLGDSMWYKGCRKPCYGTTVNEENTDIGKWTPWK